MYTQEEISGIVRQYMASLVFPAHPRELFSPIEYSLEEGGKRLRPTLLLMACNLFSEQPREALPAAAAVEIFHNFTLLHDDIMDNAEVRRGKPSVHRRWGTNAAILSGDAMMIYAYTLLEQCDPGLLPALLETFNRMAMEVCEGQQYDMDFEHRNDVTEDEYIEMIRLKTSVLLACSMKIGAILADAPAADADNLYRFGEQVGLAFQLQDDYLDVYGDPSVFGKAIGGDIVSNKKTYMLINAMNRADSEQRRRLSEWIGAKDFDAGEKIAAVRAIYDEIGIDRLALEKINHYFRQSRKYIDAVSVDRERKAELMNYVSVMMKRNY